MGTALWIWCCGCSGGTALQAGTPGPVGAAMDTPAEKDTDRNFTLGPAEPYSAPTEFLRTGVPLRKKCSSLKMCVPELPGIKESFSATPRRCPTSLTWNSQPGHCCPQAHGDDGLIRQKAHSPQQSHPRLQPHPGPAVDADSQWDVGEGKWAWHSPRWSFGVCGRHTLTFAPTGTPIIWIQGHTLCRNHGLTQSVSMR